MAKDVAIIIRSNTVDPTWCFEKNELGPPSSTLVILILASLSVITGLCSALQSHLSQYPSNLYASCVVNLIWCIKGFVKMILQLQYNKKFMMLILGLDQPLHIRVTPYKSYYFLKDFIQLQISLITSSRYEVIILRSDCTLISSTI